MENNTKPTPEQSVCESGKGRLQNCAPLANPFVPFQMSNPEQYQPAKGFIRGTMFPGLDLPFMGMVNSKEKTKTVMQQLQALAFAMTELGLYLDTHKNDAEALKLFNAYKELMDELTTEYETKYGPLTMMEAGQSGTYRWTDNPWPWDYNGQEED